jgi:soluble lytic murein transglycosylase-like protein
MTSSRSDQINIRKSRQTDQTSGCLSGFMIPPLVVLFFGVVLTLATRSLNPTQTQVQTASSISSGVLAPLFTAEIQFWAADISRWSSEHGLDPNITATVMQIESCGNPDARSGAGASGLFQVMPFHFLASENAYDPDVNALRGLDYLARSLKTSGGDARLAFAGYNGGIGVIGKPESNWAAETIRYAYWGSGIYADAIQNANISARLNEWLAAGGASLCKKARDRLGITQ